MKTFAPLIHATFGAGDVNDDDPDDDQLAPAGRPTDLRVRLADRSLRQTNPVLGVVSGLLDLAAARVTASQVLDLAGRVPHQGESVEVDGFRLVAERVQGRRIGRVRIERRPVLEAPSAED